MSHTLWVIIGGIMVVVGLFVLVIGCAWEKSLPIILGLITVFAGVVILIGDFSGSGGGTFIP